MRVKRLGDRSLKERVYRSALVFVLKDTASHIALKSGDAEFSSAYPTEAWRRASSMLRLSAKRKDESLKRLVEDKAESHR